MKDMTPLFEASQSERTRALLRAGRAEVPPAGFSDRLLVSLGIGVAVSGVSVTAAAGTVTAASGAASTGSGVAGLALVTAKWVAVGVIGGGILAGGADLALSPKRAPSVSAPVVQQRPEPKPPSATTLAAPGGSVQAPNAPEVEVAGSRPSTATSGVAEPAERGRLAREVRAIDRARQALASGNAARALVELDALERGAMSGVLDREAWILRIEALNMSGQKGRAKQLAARYRETFPNDAHAARLRAVEEEKP
jgi:hypothetical protein